MQKNTIFFECQQCGFKTKKWLGKCPNCSAWDSLVESSTAISSFNAPKKSNFNINENVRSNSQALPITQIKAQEFVKFSTGEIELDIVLGGGIVPGGLYLIGGSPGVGKSTLLLKIAGNIAKTGKKVLYVSGEESPSQISQRGARCECLSDNLLLLSEINLENIQDSIRSSQCQMCVIDSIQTIYSPLLSAAPGSVSQVRDITFTLMRYAKEFNISIFIIGHITKDGQIAGPRVLEHMVDCVLYFEGELSSELKILRGFKNRFGSTSEIGIFEMQKNGLVSANEASIKFFSAKKDMAGSAAAAIMEGSRCLVVEVQSLVSPIEFGNPKRLANGFDTNRLNMLLALLEKKIGLQLHRFDVFVNIAGGFKINETSADLALIASIISSFKNRAIKSSTAFLGEVSLIGDIREIGMLENRLKELANFGFKTAIVPNMPKNLKCDLRCVEVKEVSKILDWM